MPTSNSNQASNQLEFPKLKCFLYKYTPLFVADGAKLTDLLRVDKYNIELDESKYFSKYDVTKYVASYTFDQDIYGNTYNWSLTLQDPPLSLSQLQELKVEGPSFSTPSVAGSAGPQVLLPSLNNLAQYESQDSSAQIDVPYIQRAKSNRGNTEPDLTDKTTGTGKKNVGLRLSDIIQSYDLVSMYLYKETTPLGDLKGFKVLHVQKPIKAFYFVAEKNPSLDSVSLTAADLQQESILQSPDPTIPGKTLFSNEFNGFVLRKSISRRVGAVDLVSLQGNGITRLFGATRRILKSSLLQATIYDTTSELKGLQAITPFEHIFSGSSIQKIVMDLFDFVYNIKFNVNEATEFFTGNLASGELLQGSQTLVQSSTPTSSFYDLTSLEIGNYRKVNHFTIPPFLLGLVMKRKLFNFREVDEANLQANLVTLNIDINKAVNAPTEALARRSTEMVLNQNANLQTIYSGGASPVQFDSAIGDLRGYFNFLKDVFEFFNPETKTPFEILDEIKKASFVEIFERPDGVIVVQNPQYNNIGKVHFSSDLDIVDATYSETMEDFVSKQKVGYVHDIIGKMVQTQEFAYTDGKFLLQYGFLETSTDMNPNVKDEKSKDEQIARNREGILYRYAEFFLRIHNAKLKTGTINANLDPSIKIGDTFFDEKNQKFGYIVGLSKNVSVGQTATMTLQLSYVRDAYSDNPGEKDPYSLFFDVLPTLISINQSIKETVQTVKNPEAAPITNPSSGTGLSGFSGFGGGSSRGAGASGSF